MEAISKVVDLLANRLIGFYSDENVNESSFIDEFEESLAIAMTVPEADVCEQIFTPLQKFAAYIQNNPGVRNRQATQSVQQPFLNS